MKTLTDLQFTRDANDTLLHWDNPYVRITFFCRICKEEQPFNHQDEKWKKHFMEHIRFETQVCILITVV